jgi:uncharacterized protein YhaN
MALTAREAGERVGKTRQAIIKAIRKGTLSAEKDASGEWRIEPAELFRVYPAVPAVDDNEPATRLSSDTGSLRRELEIRDEKITSLEQRLTAVEADKADLREDRNRWRAQAEQATRLLTDQRPVARRRKWWPWG